MDQDRGHPHLLLWYVSGDLDPAQTRETEAHLAQCADCTAEAMALASMLRNLKDGMAAELPEPATDKHPDKHPADQPSTSSPSRTRDRWWRRHLPALIASFATLTILVLAAPVLIGTMGDAQENLLREAQSVVLAPPQRGMGSAKVLNGSGPWAISIVLPFGAPAGVYDLRIEAVDQPAHPVMNASLLTDAEGRLSVVVDSLPSPGRFIMSVRPRETVVATPYVYAFQTVAGAPDGA